MQRGYHHPRQSLPRRHVVVIRPRSCQFHCPTGAITWHFYRHSSSIIHPRQLCCYRGSHCSAPAASCHRRHHNLCGSNRQPILINSRRNMGRRWRIYCARVRSYHRHSAGHRYCIVCVAYRLLCHQFAYRQSATGYHRWVTYTL